MSSETEITIRLLGQPKLKDYLQFVQDSVVGGDALRQVDLVDEWRHVNDYYFELEENEAQIANEIDVFDLDPVLHHLVEEAQQDPRFCYTFDKFPTSFAMVELDKLVVSQLHINREFSEGLHPSLKQKPDPEALFRFCLPPKAPEQAVKISKSDPSSYIFSSESSDFRSHNVKFLKPNQVSDYYTFGPISGMVGLAVGFGSNFLSGISAEGRVLLHNGYHRAYAMRSAGITHAPCILQSVTRLDELEIAANRTVAEDTNYYFGTARPPLLKDFFDPNIAKEYKCYKTVKKVEINIDCREYYERV